MWGEFHDRVDELEEAFREPAPSWRVANDQCETRACSMPKMNLNLTYVLDLRHHNDISRCKVNAEAINRP